MSLPSYKLSRQGSAWIAEGTLPSGRAFRIDAGKGSRDRAEGVIEMKLRAKLASSKGSRDRWAKFHREREATRARPTTVTTAAPSGAPEVATSSAASAPPRPARPARPSDEEIRAKLLGLGDAQPIGDGDASSSSSSSEASSVEPDEVISPGAARDDDEPIDDEGGELIAGLLAKAATLGIVALANAPLKKRKPPQRGEAHEKGLEWFHDGMEVQLTKLIGKTATLGPTGKIFAGAAIIVASIYMTAEPIEGAAEATAAPPPAPAPTAPGSTNGAPPVEQRALVPTGLNLGVFGKEKN